MKVINISKEEPEAIAVNGVVISAEAIAAEAQNHPMPKGKPGWAWRSAAHALVLREVLLQQARSKNIKPDPVEISEGLWETDEEALIRQLLEEDIVSQEIDQAALRAVYDKSPQKFRSPALFEAAHILFAALPGNQAARAKARSHAELVLAEIIKDERKFAAMAAKHSSCESGKNGGLLGQLSSGDTVREFEAALMEIKPGEICPRPVETRYGFHIIRLDAYAAGQPLPFESVLPRLRQAQEKTNWVHAGREYVAALASKANIVGIKMDDTPWVGA